MTSQFLPVMFLVLNISTGSDAGLKKTSHVSKQLSPNWLMA